jgi:hypothetical protein
MSRKSKAHKAALRAAWTDEKRERMSELAKERWAARKEAGELHVGKRADLADVIFEADKKAIPNEEAKAPNEEEEGLRLSGVRRMLVCKVCVNPRLVEGVLVGEEEGSELESVDVGRNATLAIGDELLIRRHPEVLGLWEFVGMADQGLAVDMLGLPRDRRRVR